MEWLRAMKRQKTDIPIPSLPEHHIFACTSYLCLRKPVTDLKRLHVCNEHWIIVMRVVWLKSEQRKTNGLMFLKNDRDNSIVNSNEWYHSCLWQSREKLHNPVLAWPGLFFPPSKAKPVIELSRRKSQIKSSGRISPFLILWPLPS